MTTNVSQHNQSVKELWEAYAQRRNTRVPLTMAADDQLWLRVSGHTFREFYLDPRIHLQAQLEGQRWLRENAIADQEAGLPETWWVSVQQWMNENEFFGCEIVYQDDDYAWGKPLALEKDDLLKHIEDIDPLERLRGNIAFRTWQALKELTEGLEFLGRPVKVGGFGGDCHGTFTKAAEVRGLEQICVDLCEDPEFVVRLLEVMTDKTIGRIRAAHLLQTGEELSLPHESGFGMADDSLQMISARQYEEIVLPVHERIYSTMGKGPRGIHLCGPATHLYESLRWKLGILAIDGPGMFADHGRYLKEFGEDFRLSAQCAHSVVAFGTPDEIDAMMKALLTPSAKQPGRFSIMAYLSRHAPVENMRAFYEAGRKYGTIEPAPES